MPVVRLYAFSVRVYITDKGRRKNLAQGAGDAKTGPGYKYQNEGLSDVIELIVTLFVQI